MTTSSNPTNPNPVMDRLAESFALQFAAAAGLISLPEIARLRERNAILEDRLDALRQMAKDWTATGITSHATAQRVADGCDLFHAIEGL